MLRYRSTKFDFRLLVRGDLAPLNFFFAHLEAYASGSNIFILSNWFPLMMIVQNAALMFILLAFGMAPRIALANESRASIAFECKGKVSKSDLEAALAKVQSEYQKVGTVSANFDQDSYLAALNASESSSGKVLFSKPGRMKWSYVDPEIQEFVLKERTVWLYQPEIKQVMIDELSQLLLTDLPVSFLMGVGSLKESFKLKEGCQSSIGAVLILEPKSEQKSEEGNSLKSFKLLVTADGFPAGAQVLDVVGNVTTIVLSEIRQNAIIEDSQFAVKYPTGTDVNDRRVNKG